MAVSRTKIILNYPTVAFWIRSILIHMARESFADKTLRMLKAHTARDIASPLLLSPLM